MNQVTTMNWTPKRASIFHFYGVTMFFYKINLISVQIIFSPKFVYPTKQTVGKI